jgi:hypothetical protein
MAEPSLKSQSDASHVNTIAVYFKDEPHRRLKAYNTPETETRLMMYTTHDTGRGTKGQGLLNHKNLVAGI